MWNNIISDLLPELIEKLISQWGLLLTLLVILIWRLLKRYLDSVENRVNLVEERADKEIDRLVKERDRLQDIILEKRISSGRSKNAETSNS